MKMQPFQVCCELHLRTGHDLSWQAGSSCWIPFIPHKSISNWWSVMIQCRLKHLNRCSASVWSATGLKVTAGAPLSYSPSLLGDLARTGVSFGHDVKWWAGDVRIGTTQSFICEQITQLSETQNLFQILPGPLAGGDWKAFQFWGTWCVDPGGRCSCCHRLYWSRRRLSLYLKSKKGE